MFAVAPRDAFRAGLREITVRVSDDSGMRQDVPYRLLGPTTETAR